ncbi:MAG: STM4011 family radical SAM protein [Prevotellaceae bacterium]|jgi:hypothetical protein|nr:STM4011 family radical SAM protein [Prevotellaceae bacterium]
MIPDTVIHIYYRGFLKSCNYSCSYCPFAKRPVSQKELEKDKEAISRFILWVKRQKNTLSIMFVPYGEALMHIHYIKAFASLSKMPHVTAISCQTNLSLNADKFIKRLNEENADLSKINLWTTFHSEMVNKENFVEKIHYLNQHIDLCAGIAGSPQTIAEAADLRKLLPKSVYLWVNAMDRIYLATALPFIYAMRKCKTIRAYLSGGIFANGTDIRDIDSKYRHVVSMLPINISVSKGVRTLVLRIKFFI